MQINILIGFLISHFISDFVLQPRDIAESKGFNIKSLIVHGGEYFVYFTVINMLILLPFYGNVLVYLRVIDFCAINTVAHLLIDFITSKLTSRYYKNGDNKMFFNIIGFDQLLHTSIIVYSYFQIFKNLN